MLKKLKVTKVTKDTIIADILQLGDEAAEILLSIGMHCLGCPASQGETIEEACQVHEVDVNEIIQKLNECVSDKA